MKNLLLAALLLISTAVFSQTTIIEDYTEVFKDNLVKVSVAQGEFKNESRNLSHSRYFLKYENLTDQEIEVTILKELHYGDRCYGCNDNEESYKTIAVPANSSLFYDETNNDKRFYFFAKDNNGLIKSQLTDFTIKIIKTIIL